MTIVAARDTFYVQNPARDLVFSNEPVDGTHGHSVLAQASADGIAQILPVASAGVSGVAVHIGSIGQQSDLKLRAQLLALEDLQTVDAWLVSGAELSSGWNLFGLSEPSVGLRRTLEFRLQVETPDGALPSLSVGGVQPVEAFQVRDAATGVPILKNSLAVQIWAGNPGQALSPQANYIPALPRQSEMVRGFSDLPVAPAVLEHAILANADQVSFGFKAVMPFPAEGAIGCHPPAEGMTIGLLPAACPPRAVRMAAKAFIDNTRAGGVDFAIVVAEDLAAASALFNETREQVEGEAFSGWKALTFGETAHLSAFSSERTETWRNVYFATRMSEPGCNDFSWAKFADFHAVTAA
jgi:hypothetical protein